MLVILGLMKAKEETFPTIAFTEPRIQAEEQRSQSWILGSFENIFLRVLKNIVSRASLFL